MNITEKDLVELVKILNPFNIKMDDYLKIKKNFTHNEPDLVIAAIVINKIIEIDSEKMKKLPYKQYSFAFFELALWAIERKINPRNQLNAAHYYQLKEYQQREVIKRVQILSAPKNSNSCQSCKEINGKIFTLEQALQHEPLPYHNCTNDYFQNGFSWCRCIYLPLVD